MKKGNKNVDVSVDVNVDATFNEIEKITDTVINEVKNEATTVDEAALDEFYGEGDVTDDKVEDPYNDDEIIGDENYVEVETLPAEELPIEEDFPVVDDAEYVGEPIDDTSSIDDEPTDEPTEEEEEEEEWEDDEWDNEDDEDDEDDEDIWNEDDESDGFDEDDEVIPDISTLREVLLSNNNDEVVETINEWSVQRLFAHIHDIITRNNGYGFLRAGRHFRKDGVVHQSLVKFEKEFKEIVTNDDKILRIFLNAYIKKFNN
jgi:hypothetical protein